MQNAGSNFSEREFSQRIFKMLIADLKVTGHFVVQESKETISSEMLNFDEYRKNKIDLVARIKAEKVGNGVMAKLQLYDANSGLVALSKEYQNTQQEAYPFLAHKMAIDINNYIKAPSVDWMERMVILAYYTKSGESDIIMSDYTLSYKKKVISGGLNIFPKWANTTQSAFYYTKYLDKPTLFRFDLTTGQNKKMFDSNGMLVASDVSNDGNKILVTMAPNEQPDIFMYDVTNGALKHLQSIVVLM